MKRLNWNKHWKLITTDLLSIHNKIKIAENNKDPREIKGLLHEYEQHIQKQQKKKIDYITNQLETADFNQKQKILSRQLNPRQPINTIPTLEYENKTMDALDALQKSYRNICKQKTTSNQPHEIQIEDFIKNMETQTMNQYKTSQRSKLREL